MDKTNQQVHKITHPLIREAALVSLGWYLWLLILNSLTSGYVEQILPVSWFGWLAGALMVVSFLNKRLD